MPQPPFPVAQIQGAILRKSASPIIYTAIIYTTFRCTHAMFIGKSFKMQNNDLPFSDSVKQVISPLPYILRVWFVGMLRIEVHPIPNVLHEITSFRGVTKGHTITMSDAELKGY